MTAPDPIVFLLDVDNTLLDNDRIVADLDDLAVDELSRAGQSRHRAGS